MGNYLGVNAVKKFGNEQSVFGRTKPNVKKDEFLVAIVCNGVWAIAPEVTVKSEYEEFYNSYSQGNWLTFKVYIISEENREKCPDEGRVDCMRKVSR